MRESLSFFGAWLLSISVPPTRRGKDQRVRGEKSVSDSALLLPAPLPESHSELLDQSR